MKQCCKLFCFRWDLLLPLYFAAPLIAILNGFLVASVLFFLLKLIIRIVLCGCIYFFSHVCCPYFGWKMKSFNFVSWFGWVSGIIHTDYVISRNSRSYYEQIRFLWREYNYEVYCIFYLKSISLGQWTRLWYRIIQMHMSSKLLENVLC